MSKYRKKPVVVEAVQWTGENFDELQAFMKDGVGDFIMIEQRLDIYTLEGSYFAQVGDYIIKDEKGEFYSCKPNIFRKTYEEVTDEG